MCFQIKCSVKCNIYSTIVYLHTLLVAITPPWAWPRGAMVTKIYQYHNVPPFYQFYKKVVLWLSGHGDVIETQTRRFVPPKFFSKLGPWSVALTFCCVQHLTDVTAFRNFASVCSTVLSATKRTSFNVRSFVIDKSSLEKRAKFKFIIKYCRKRRNDRPGKSKA